MHSFPQSFIFQNAAAVAAEWDQDRSQWNGDSIENNGDLGSGGVSVDRLLGRKL